MKILFIIYCLVNLYLNGVPRSDFCREGIELEFGYYFAVNGSTGKLVRQIKGIYNYTLAVRQGSSLNELIAIIRDIHYSPNQIQRLTVNDLSAFQLPFLIETHRNGELKRIVTTSKETRSSLKLKYDLVELLVYNREKVSKQFRATILQHKTLQTELEQTLLGNCLANVTGSQTPTSYVFFSVVERFYCEGPIQFGKILGRKLKFSDNSSMVKTLKIDKKFKELELASVETRFLFNAERASSKRSFGHVKKELNVLYQLQYLRAVKYRNKISRAQFRVSFSRDQLVYDL